MINSYIVDEKTKKFRIFRDDKPPTFKPTKSPLHKHEYSEVHLVSTGYLKCTVEGTVYILRDGDTLLIPSGAYHSTDSDDISRVHFSFQVGLEASKIVKRHFPKEFIADLFSRLASGDNSIGTLSYICTELAGTTHYKIENTYDYKYVIGNFFDKRYHEKIGIKDLAAVLHLSKMQTQRLVKKHTGMTFGENLRKYRIKVAEYLMSNSKLTNEEIARSVGYSSYSGFWKARSKDGK